jgi:hypothetical protein
MLPGGAGLRRHAMGRREQRAGGGRDHLCRDVSDGVIAGAVELVHGHANDTAAATGASAMTAPGERFAAYAFLSGEVGEVSVPIPLVDGARASLCPA